MKKLHAIILLLIGLMIFSGCQKKNNESTYPKLYLPETGSVESPDDKQPYLQPIYYLEGTVSGSEVGRYISKDTGEIGDNSITALVPALQLK